MTEPIVTQKIETLMAEFGRSGVRELHVRSGDFELFLSSDSTLRPPVERARGADRSPPQPTPSRPEAAHVPAAAKAPKSSPAPSDATIVRAPNLGTFYRAPKPGAAFYVEVGAEVQPETEICLIEVMKLFTAVRAGVTGRVQSILAEDGAMVEAGQPLFAIVERS